MSLQFNISFHFFFNFPLYLISDSPRGPTPSSTHRKTRFPRSFRPRNSKRDDIEVPGHVPDRSIHVSCGDHWHTLTPDEVTQIPHSSRAKRSRRRTQGPEHHGGSRINRKLELSEDIPAGTLSTSAPVSGERRREEVRKDVA